MDCFSFARHIADNDHHRHHHHHRSGDGNSMGKTAGIVAANLKFDATEDVVVQVEVPARPPIPKPPRRARFAAGAVSSHTSTHGANWRQRQDLVRSRRTDLALSSGGSGAEDEDAESGGAGEAAETESLLSLVDADFHELRTSRAAMAAMFPRPTASVAGAVGGESAALPPPLTAPARVPRPGRRAAGAAWGGEFIRPHEPPRTAAAAAHPARRMPDTTAVRGGGSGDGISGIAVGGSGARPPVTPRAGAGVSESRSQLYGPAEESRRAGGGSGSCGGGGGQSAAAAVASAGLGRLPSITTYVAVPLLPSVLPSVRLSAAAAAPNSARF